jgi:hypothetical protein
MIHLLSEKRLLFSNKKASKSLTQELLLPPSNWSGKMIRKYIVKANKDIGVLMEMTTSVMETSRRKAKKAFKKANKNWKIVDIRAKEPEDDTYAAPEMQLAMDAEILGSALAI